MVENDWHNLRKAIHIIGDIKYGGKKQEKDAVKKTKMRKKKNKNEENKKK